MSQNVCVCVYIYMYIPPFCVLLMEGHTRIEQVLRPAIFWDCVQHKVVTTFQHFGITNQSCLQGSRCPSRTCLGSIQLDPWRQDRLVIPKHWNVVTTLCCTQTQKTAGLKNVQFLCVFPSGECKMVNIHIYIYILWHYFRKCLRG